MLWLHYEDLLQDLEGCVREIAAFMPGVDEHDEELIAIAVKQADIEFMKQVWMPHSMCTKYVPMMITHST